jgi:hypothetical protein
MFPSVRISKLPSINIELPHEDRDFGTAYLREGRKIEALWIKRNIRWGSNAKTIFRRKRARRIAGAPSQIVAAADWQRHVVNDLLMRCSHLGFGWRPKPPQRGAPARYSGMGLVWAAAESGLILGRDSAIEPLRLDMAGLKQPAVPDVLCTLISDGRNGALHMNEHRTALVLFAAALGVVIAVASVTTLESVNRRKVSNEAMPGTIGLARPHVQLDRAPGKPLKDD